MAHLPHIDWFDPDEISKLSHSIDWGRPNFALWKSYFFAVFAKLVYHEITNIDHKQVRRATVIPCFAFQELVVDQSSELSAILAEIGAELADVDEQENYFAAIIRFPKLIIVSIRGTASLFDWEINLDARRIRFEGGKFHRGFFNETLEHLKLLKGRRTLHGAALYITGHSLGGALASLLGLVAHNDGRCDLKSVYTYGAPRYSDNRFDHSWHEPYACIRNGDPVPDTPPLRFGYENPSIQLNPSGSPAAFPRGMSEWEYVRFSERCLRAKTFPAHMMENYLGDINRAVRLAHGM